MGMERVLLLLQEKNLVPVPRTVDVYLVQQGEGAQKYALKLAQQMRSAGLSVQQHCGEGSFKSQMKKADGVGAAFAVIVGENELAAGTAIVKPLRLDAEQRTVACDAVAEAIASFKN
jgi:histidyl-tRNA synthetase